MKRLIKKAFDTTLYHITDFQGFVGILKDGLIHAWAPANAGIDQSSSEGVDRLEDGSERNLYKDNLMQINVYQKHTKDNIDNYLGRVFLLNEKKMISSMDTYGDVAIKLRLPHDSLLPDNNDCTRCKTAEESLEKIGQCSVIGDITSDYFDSYLFFDTHKNVILEKNAKGVSGDINSFFTSEDIVTLIDGKRYSVDEFFKVNIDLDQQLQKKVVRSNPYQILKINNPSEELQLEAVKSDGLMIQHFENPSAEVQLEAVKQDGWAIKYIKNPSEEIKLAAVRQTGTAISYIKHPSEEVELEAVKKTPYAIRYIIYPSKTIQLEAVKKDVRALQEIENPKEEVQIEAVKIKLEALNFIKNPSERVQLEAVNRYNFAISYIENPTEKVQIMAVKKEPMQIAYIKNPCEQAQLIAIKENKNLFHRINNPTNKVKEEYEKMK